VLLALIYLALWARRFYPTVERQSRAIEEASSRQASG
jgi:hypothetical protein